MKVTPTKVWRVFAFQPGLLRHHFNLEREEGEYSGTDLAEAYGVYFSTIFGTRKNPRTLVCMENFHGERLGEFGRLYKDDLFKREAADHVRNQIWSTKKEGWVHPKPYIIHGLLRSVRWTQKEASDIAGTTQQNFRKWLAGSTPMPYAPWRLMMFEAGFLPIRVG